METHGREPVTPAPAPAAMRRLLVISNLIVAILNILAALLLLAGEKSVGVPGLAEAPHHEPIIVHCLLTALLLFAANALLKRPSVTSAAAGMAVFALWFLMGALAMLDFQLALVATFEFSPATAGALLLVFPAIQLFWNASAILKPQGGAPQPDNPESIDGIDSRILAAAEQSRRPPPDSSFYVNFLSVFATLFAVALIFVIPIAYSDLLQSAIFDRRFDGWTAFFESIATVMDEHAVLTATATAGMFGVTFGSVVMTWLQQPEDGYDHVRASRDLLHGELALIGRATANLARYANGLQVRELYSVLLAVFMIAMLAGGFAVAMLAVRGGSGLGADLLERQRTQGLPWSLYIDELGAGDLLLVVSALMAVFCVAFVIASWLSRLGIRGILSLRRNKVHKDDPWAYYRLAIATDVRHGRLKPGKAFDPEAYVYADFSRYARGFYILTAILVFLNLAIFYLDRMDYDLLSEEYIETTDYLLPGVVHRFAYDDVKEVGVACARDDDYDFDFAWRMVFRDGRTIEPVGRATRRRLRSTLTERLDAWERVDAKLRAAGVKVLHLPPNRQGPRFDAEACREELESVLNSETVARVLRLLRESGEEAPPPRLAAPG